MQGITPFLWFDTQAEEAANFYVSIFDDARVTDVTRYPEGAPGPAGQVMTVSFELFGQDFAALNGGPLFPFTEAISFVVNCTDQEEVDRYWNALADGGTPQQCGWIKDRFGVSWQIVPTALGELFAAGDAEQGQRVMQAMLAMVKLEIAPLQAAFDGR
jgi:predicted 3-demethylubiquinone-9 3-methyltransferase (glyoxalase superfamily)